MPAAPSTPLPLVIVLLGPTASGKTDLAIALAQALNRSVLNIDSRQIYRGMDVGTAKPTPAQRQAAPHELLDLRNPDAPLNLQEFCALAQAAMAQQFERDDHNRPLALLAGGTGLYLKALTQGMAPPPVPPQPQLRSQLEALGQPLCHQLLAEADPTAAARIAAADAVRTQRALEVIYATGRPLTGQQGSNPPAWEVLELGLNPPDLASRIDGRTEALFENGLLEETETLMQRFGPELELLGTIGYDEARRHLAGEISRAAAVASTSRRTRQYAKRQRTWFRRQHNPQWLTGTDLQQQIEQALQVVKQVLG
ncbi:MAG: tRNA (adenosine(37)-N6)-dimethylallyltransferase MiaA [Cyanobacteriota bacterium]|nr:tRNA (adenosine(37)-N6)-dimethylallyltransferase MiaA [Cyanobacteriota bacterium]